MNISFFLEFSSTGFEKKQEKKRFFLKKFKKKY